MTHCKAFWVWFEKFIDEAESYKEKLCLIQDKCECKERVAKDYFRHYRFMSDKFPFWLDVDWKNKTDVKGAIAPLPEFATRQLSTLENGFAEEIIAKLYEYCETELETPTVTVVERIIGEVHRSKIDLDPLPEREYRCIVIDPPWPTRKIPLFERGRLSNRAEFDYPSMTLDEISNLPITELANTDGCHIYLWTTHRFMPEAFRLFNEWGVNYECLLTWVKELGMTPYSFRYTTEHILFGRIGSLKLLRFGEPLHFIERHTHHSRKPGVFFDKIADVSPAPRLNMFSREPREGFEAWGAEDIDI